MQLVAQQMLRCKLNFFVARITTININNNSIYYINNSEIPGELSRENVISSHVKLTRY